MGWGRSGSPTKSSNAFGWTARVPRLGGAKFVDLLTKLESELIEFTHHCNENGIEGTVVLEPNLIEFHFRCNDG